MEHPTQLSWGQRRQAGAHFFGKCGHTLFLVVYVKYRGGDQLACLFPITQKRVDPGSDLLSFVIAHLCLQLASENGVSARQQQHESQPFQKLVEKQKATGPGFEGSGGAQGFYD